MTHASVGDPTRTGHGGGPALYVGYCTRSGRYRMMDLPDYLANVQQGMWQLLSDGSALYQDMASRLYDPSTHRGAAASHARGACGCRCECCVSDADVLVHARCGERRRIPVAFENETRRERPVQLTLEKFVTAGGRDLGWPAQLSEAEFTLRPCEERTIVVEVELRCPTAKPQGEPGKPGGDPAKASRQPPRATAAEVPGSVDRCEVGYATLRAEGCLVRPVVLAVAVLPDDCDAFRRPCGCGCCH